MQIYLTAGPEHLSKALRYTRRLAHAAYRIGPEGRLLRQNQPSQIRGGLMVVDDRDCGPIRDRDALCREVWRECVGRGYSGAAADFEQPVSGDRLAFLEKLCAAMVRTGRRLYLPEGYALQVPGSTAVICTALSGGTFQQRLEEARTLYDRGLITKEEYEAKRAEILKDL